MEKTVKTHTPSGASYWKAVALAIYSQNTFHVLNTNPMKKLTRYAACAFLLITGSAQAQFITNTGLPVSNSAHITTNGSWTNASGAAFLNDGIIETSDAFTNSGTLDPAGKGGFILKFDADLSFTPGGTQIGFLHKTGTGRALIGSTISIKDSLILNQGVLEIVKPTDTLDLKTNAILKASPTAFVQGMVSRGGLGMLTFPVGMDGYALPITLHKVQAKKVIVSVADAPASPVAGPGVDALIDFPYAWTVQKKSATDTAAYVELSYPDVLPTVEDAIVVRQTSTDVFASMGARFIDHSAGHMTVRSYSRGLQGLYTVAQGFPYDPVTDSLALVALFDATEGSSWSNKSNWTTSSIDSWFGIFKTGQTITGIQLPGNNLSGPVPDQLTDILGLETIDLSNNSITAIPDFSGSEDITQLDVSNNKLDFASLEPNALVSGLVYTGQTDFGTPVDSLVEVGTSYTFVANAGGDSTTYQWMRNGEDIEGASATAYSLEAINRSNMGEYKLVANNPRLPLLTLNSNIQKAQAYATISGTFISDDSVGITTGEMTLYRVKPDAFEVTATTTVEEDGAYIFEKVILDDYQVRGYADPVEYERAIPTYYKNTIFWEEADTVKLEDHRSDIGIVSQDKPLPPSGHGIISGYLQEDDGTGRSDGTMKPQRVSSAGVSARRVERTGRSKEVKLTLVAYTLTNEEGEFNLSNLPVGDYRLNIQYPGYPMDTTSFITITIGDALKSQVQVEANVVEGKIAVRQLVITGIYERQDYKIDLYPNPAVETIRLQFQHESQGRKITLFDMNGKELISENAEKKDAVMNVSQMAKGLYLLHVNDNGTIVKTLKVGIE
jgi:hypothetical protein